MHTTFILSSLLAFCAIFSAVRAQSGSGNAYVDAYWSTILSKQKLSFTAVQANEMTTILHGRQAFPATSPALIVTGGEWDSNYYNKYIDTPGTSLNTLNSARGSFYFFHSRQLFNQNLFPPKFSPQHLLSKHEFLIPHCKQLWNHPLVTWVNKSFSQVPILLSRDT
jgi:hypothetical protein